MSRKKGRAGGRRGGFLAKARTSGSSFLRKLGFGKNSFTVSNAVIAASAIVPVVLPAQTVVNSSPWDVLTGKYNPALSMGQRISLALASYAHTALGYSALLKDVHGGTPAPATKGIGVLGVGTGVAMKIAGKFINPMMSGSPVKL